MKLLRLYFILAALFLWVTRYVIVWPLALFVLVMLFVSPIVDPITSGINWGASLVAFFMVVVLFPLIHYLSFLFQIAMANAISRYLKQEPVLSNKIGMEFFRSFQLYKNIYTGELKTQLSAVGVKIEQEFPAKEPSLPDISVETNEPKYSRYPGGTRYHEISFLVKNLPPCLVKEKSEEVLTTLETIYENFEKDEDDIKRSIHVIPSMLDSMLSILQQYRAVESLVSSSQNKEKIETQVFGILGKLKNALEHHLRNLLENDMIALDAEIGLLGSLIRSEGLDPQSLSSGEK